MTAAEIIVKFELQVDDVTELSSQEELDLLNKIYITDVCADRPWEILKVPASGTILQDANGYYIDLPADFGFLAENNQSTLNNISVENNAAPIVIYIGTNFQPYQVVNFSDRRQFRLRDGFAYVDIAHSQIRFMATPVGTSYEFDYIKVPAALALGDSPIFPERFHMLLYYRMATENNILQLSDKAKSYATENATFGKQTFDSMCYWNAKLQVN